MNTTLPLRDLNLIQIPENINTIVTGEPAFQYDLNITLQKDGRLTRGFTNM